MIDWAFYISTLNPPFLPAGPGGVGGGLYPRRIRWQGPYALRPHHKPCMPLSAQLLQKAGAWLAADPYGGG